MVVVGFVTWQSSTYSGIVALLAEWQFTAFGVYRPLLTLCLLVAGLVLLPPLCAWLLRSGARRRGRDRSNSLHGAIRSAERFRNVLLLASLCCLVACGVVLALARALPTDSGNVQHLTASVSTPAAPTEGLSRVSGTILYDKTVEFEENLWFIRYKMHFAPIVDHGAGDRAVRYFIELPSGEKAAPAPALAAHEGRGILKRQGLPGELVRLYQNAGYSVASPNYVLFRSPEIMRWPYYAWAWAFGTAAVLIGFCALIQTARRWRLIRIAARELPSTLS